MKIPEKIKPILLKITKPEGHELEFWKFLDGDQLTDKLFELSSELILSELDEDTLPKGYKLVAYLYYWEHNCQFSGWYAFHNLKSYTSKIIECYREIGMSSEASALEKAEIAWFESDGDHDKTGVAYGSVENEYKVDFDRFDFFIDYFKKNAHLFYD